MRPQTGRVLVCRVLILVLAFGGACRATANDFPGVEAPIELFRRYQAAVVRVKSAAEGIERTRDVTTGFFIDTEGRVLTNLPNGQITRVWIEKDGLQYAAELIGSDPRSALGLLQVLKLPANFAVIPIESRASPLPIASKVLGITSPAELDASPTEALVTGYESAYSIYPFPCTYGRVSFLLGDGEGGSPILDMQGKLVGVGISRVPVIRSSYFVPASALVRIVDELKQHRRVRYGTLQIEFTEDVDPLGVSRVVKIRAVAPNSAAERAGVRAGDIVRRLGETTVQRLDHVRDALFFTAPGEYLSMEVERDGRRLPFFTLPVEELPEQNSTSAGPTPASRVEPSPLPAPIPAGG